MQNLRPLLFLYLFAMLLIGACKADPKDSKKTNSKVKDAIITTMIDAEPDGLMPYLARQSHARTIFRYIFSPMLQFDPYTLEYAPVLAKAKPIIAKDKATGNYTYTFEIRDDAEWDDGSPITAADYIFTIKSIFNPKVGSRYKPALDFIKDIKTDTANPKKFTIYTKECYIGAEENLSTLEVIPAYNYDPEGLMAGIPLADLLDEKKSKKLTDNENIAKFAEQFISSDYTRLPKNIAGSGPYKLTEFTTNQKLVLEKKKDWWGTALAGSNPIFEAYPSKIIYKVVADVTTALTMLKNGELDVMARIPFENYDELINNALAKENLNFYTPPMPAYFYYAINNERPHLSDKKVRRALAHIVDLDDYITNTAKGNSTQIAGPILPTKSYFNKNIKPIKHDLEKAKSILDEAGWIDSNSDGIRDKKVNGKQLDLTVKILLPTTSVDGKNISAVMKDHAKKVGVNVELLIKDTKAAGKDVVQGNYDMYLLGTTQTLGLDDPQNKFHTEKIPPNGGNYARCGNAEVDRIIEDILSSCDDKALRDKKFLEFQEKIYEEQPFIFLFTNNETLAVNKRFGNAKGSNMRPGYFESRFIADY